MIDLKLSVARDFTAHRINEVVNDPSVRPWVGAGTDAIDLTAAVMDARNVLLMGQGGGLLFIWQAPGLYEVHTQFVEGSRGALAIEAVRDALRWMFTRTDATEILTKVPDGNGAALGLVRAINGDYRFHRPNCWATAQGIVGVKHYSLGIDRWAAKADALKATGEWFHHKLEAAKLESGAQSPIHDEDDAHDLYVGATCEMVLHGHLEKAVDFYTRWARFAGYGPVRVIAADPTVIDIGDAILAVRNMDFEVLLCR